MGMTLTEKILARHAGRERVAPGELILAKVDLALGNDVTSPIAIQAFRSLKAGAVFDPERIALVPDHFAPNKDIKSAEQVKMMREFAKEFGIVNYFEVGRMGIEHVLLPDEGLVVPGDLVIGADSHTCTYGALCAFSTGVGSTDLAAVMATGDLWLKVPSTIKIEYRGKLRPWVGGKDLVLYTIGLIGVEGALYSAMEFTGETVRALPMNHRFTMANMAIEAGAKNGIFEADEETFRFLNSRTRRAPRIFRSDPDAGYSRVIEVDAAALEPQVAFPSSPANARPLSQAGGIPLDQVFIGSCTNGWLEDLRDAASILKGRKAAPGLRLIMIPSTPDIYRKALQEGIIETFLDAGAVIGPPCCGPCLGGHMGILAAGEKALATTNRNFVGRMGHPKSEVYLANPHVAAASAILGRIAGPGEI